MEPSNKQAILPIYKSMRLRKLKSGENYKDGLKPINKNDVGVVFPFERTKESIAEGVKCILGFSYGRKVFLYWIPKIARLKEMMFERKPIRVVNKLFDLTDLLSSLKVNKSTYFKRVKRNYLYDFSSILSSVFPEFNNIQKWNSPLAFRNVDTFIIEWLKFVLINPINKDNTVIKTSMFMYGEGVTSVHKLVLMGINVKTMSQSMVKFLNPSVISIPRMVKTNLDNYIPMIIMRSLIAGSMNYKEDKTLTTIYEILKDVSIVFYNNRGISFLYNTSEDENVKKLNGNQMLLRMKMLFQKIISTNISPTEDVEEEVTDDEIIAIKNNDSETELKDDELDNLIDVINKSSLTNGLSAINKINKKDTVDEDINEEDIADNDADISTVLDDLEQDEIPEEQEDETDTGMLDDTEDTEDGGKTGDTTDTKDIKSILDTVGVGTKPSMTKAQRQRLDIAKEKYKSIFIDGRSIPEILADTKAKLIERTLSVNTVSNDPSVQNSTLIDFEKSYVKNTMEHDILSMVKSLSTDKSVNMHIVDVTKDDTSDQTTSKYTYVFKFIDERQKNHSIKIDIPKVDNDGFLMISGNRKLLKKQLTFLPVVKCKPDEVIISSSYNKCFIYRQGSTLTRGISSLFKLLSKDLLTTKGFEIFSGDNEKNNKNYITTIEYDVIASKYYKFIVGFDKMKSIEFIFNQEDLRNLIKNKFPSYVVKSNMLPIGINWKTWTIIEYNIENDKKSVCDYIFDSIRDLNVIPDIYDKIATMNIVKRRMYTRIMVQSREFPLVSFLGGLFGLSKILNTEKINVEFSEKRIIKDTRLYIRFSDGYLYYNDENISASLLLNGLSYMSTEEYTFADFDTERPYIDYFYETLKTRNVYKGHTAFRELFIDPITEEILKDLKLPTDFLELFLYANSLLIDNSYKNEIDLENYRVRGYENISVILYKMISAQYRIYKQNSSGMGRMSIQQDQLMTALHKSFILENYDATNPINEIKNKSIVTFKGPGGVNNDRVFNLAKRSFDYSAIGVMAVSSPDGAGAGIVKHLTLNPKILSTRGYIDFTKNSSDIDKLKIGNLASAEELDAPFLNFHDDPKRISIASTQTKHIIKINNASIPIISTGMDMISPYIVGETYVPKAKGTGIIEKMDESTGTIIVLYDDGSKESINLGMDIQRNSSFFFGNKIIPNVVQGQKIKKGDILAYEKDFFKKDTFGDVRNTQGTLAKFVMHEKSTTDEDSLSITQTLADKMGTTVIMRKQISLSKNTNLITYKKLGDYVYKYNPLITFEDSEDDYTSELLASLGDVDQSILDSAKQMPKSNATGEIVDIKVYFTVPLEELTDSLYKFIKEWEKSIKKKIAYNKLNGVSTVSMENMLKPTKPTQTGTTSRINGAVVNNDGAVLVEYFISHKTPMGVGDKSTCFANLKNIVAQVIPKGQEPITEDGVVLDGCISIFSITNRMCYAILMYGTMAHCLVERSKQIAKEYLNSFK